MLTKENIGFGALQWVSFSCYAIILGFNVMYFQHAGLSPIAIAAILTATNILNIFAQPAVGYVSDYIFPIRRVIIALTVISAVFVTLLPFAGSYFIPVLLIYQIVSFTRNTMPSVVDSYSTKISSKRSGLDFGFTRSLGSFGYAITALALGILIDRFGFSVMFVLHAVMCALQLLVLHKLEEYPLMKRQKPAQEEETRDDGFLKSASRLLKLRSFVIVTLLALLMFIGVNGTAVYITYLVLEVGGSNKDFGIILFLSACIEVPVLWNYKRISMRIDDRYILLVSFVGYFIKNIMFSMAGSVMALMLMQAINLFTYGAFLPSFLRYIQRLIPEELTATGIIMSTVVYSGLGNVIGVFIGGIILNSHGIRTLYHAGAACSAVAMVLLAISIILEKNSERGFKNGKRKIC